MYANQLEINMRYDQLIVDISIHIFLGVYHNSVILTRLLLRTLKYSEYSVCNIEHTISILDITYIYVYIYVIKHSFKLKTYPEICTIDIMQKDENLLVKSL